MSTIEEMRAEIDRTRLLIRDAKAQAHRLEGLNASVAAERDRALAELRGYRARVARQQLEGLAAEGVIGAEEIDGLVKVAATDPALAERLVNGRRAVGPYAAPRRLYLVQDPPEDPNGSGFAGMVGAAVEGGS